MNYYIQGNKYKSDQIKAAFEKIGYDVTGFDICNDNILFFTYKLQTGGQVLSTTNANLYTADIIKTHPDYQELELPTKPNFKVGDWVVTDYGKVSQVVSVDKDGDGYTLDDGVYFSGSWCDMYHHWDIQDVKDGDVLIDTLSGTHALTILFRCINEDDSISAYCGWNGYTFRVTIDGLGYGTLSSTRYVPATKEQSDLLFAKMKEAGYQWNVKKKELRKIKPHYDIANFKPFDKVLVRCGNNEEWMIEFYCKYDTLVHTSPYRDYPFMGIGDSYSQCIPFEGNEHLLGTTDMCDEQFINW